MHRHLSIAMEQAQYRLKQEQQQKNTRRRRHDCDRAIAIETFSITTIDAPETPCDKEDRTESNNHNRTIHESLTDHNEILDIDTDFDIDSLMENANEFQSDVDIDCETSIDDQDEPLTLDDLFLPNIQENNNFLHQYTTTKTNDFCRQLVKIFRDANISNVHCSRILQVISTILPQPHHLPTTLKALYNSMNGKL